MLNLVQPALLAMADRVRAVLASDPDAFPAITERNMFGGVCFMTGGNMLCGPVRFWLLRDGLPVYTFCKRGRGGVCIGAVLEEDGG